MPRFLQLLVLTAFTLPPASTHSQSPESKTQTFPVRGYVPDRSAVESLFDAVDPAADRWRAEVVNEAIEDALHSLEEALRERRPETISAILDPGFRAPSLAPSKVESLPAPAGVDLARLTYSNEPSLTADGAATAILDWVEDFRSFSVMKFKIVAVELVTGPQGETPEAHTRVLYDFAGPRTTEGILARQGWWQITWVSDDGWKMKKLEIEPATEGWTQKPFFTDVSSLAWADVSSYWLQMGVGVDYFRATMDAASGIDLYGHNGLAVADVDGDGHDDLFVAQPQGLPNRLYRNLGNGKLEDISHQAGVDLLERTSAGLFGDIDNDGDQDLFAVIQNWTVVLLLNDGTGRFDLSRTSFVRKDGAEATLSSASLADYDADGHLDLYVTSYRYFDAPGEDTALPLPYPYHDATNGPPNVLFRNRGDASFEDVTAEAGLDQGNDRFSFSSSWGDFNGDGRPDLYVANDFGRNNLYENLGEGQFREVSAAAGVEDVGAGMSVAWSDYDHDGWDDLYVGNMWSSAGQRLTGQPGYQSAEVRDKYVRHAKGNSLFRNLGDGRFDDVGKDAGVEFGRWAWSSDFIDVDNDGNEDIYSANGYITNTSTKDL